MIFQQVLQRAHAVADACDSSAKMRAVRLSEPAPAVCPPAVLVVEDDQDCANLIATWARDAGACEVLKARTLGEAAKLVGQRLLSLAVVDWKLPSDDGGSHATAAVLLALLARRGIERRVFTGYDLTGEDTHGTEVLQKTFDRDALRAWMRATLERQREASL